MRADHNEVNLTTLKIHAHHGGHGHT